LVGVRLFLFLERDFYVEPNCLWMNGLTCLFLLDGVTLNLLVSFPLLALVGVLSLDLTSDLLLLYLLLVWKDWFIYFLLVFVYRAEPFD
jgi:hypothetical protein